MRRRKILFSRNSPVIAPLWAKIKQQNHRAIVLWTLDGAKRYLSIYEAAFQSDPRPRELLEAGWFWAQGQMKTPEAKKWILEVHRIADALDDHPVEQAALRALAHAVAAIHVETHALGMVFYGLTALAYQAQPEGIDAFAQKEIQAEIKRLGYWAKEEKETKWKWAGFLRKDAPNKEALLHQERKGKE